MNSCGSQTGEFEYGEAFVQTHGKTDRQAWKNKLNWIVLIFHSYPIWKRKIPNIWYPIGEIHARTLDPFPRKPRAYVTALPTTCTCIHYRRPPPSPPPPCVNSLSSGSTYWWKKSFYISCISLFSFVGSMHSSVPLAYKAVLHVCQTGNFISDSIWGCCSSICFGLRPF